jgi:hypothetical protein
MEESELETSPGHSEDADCVEKNVRRLFISEENVAALWRCSKK